MHISTIRKNRILLIHALEVGHKKNIRKDIYLEYEASLVDKVVHRVRHNSYGDYLAVSEDNIKQVSYALSREDKYNYKRRRRSSLISYVLKKFPEAEFIPSHRLDKIFWEFINYIVMHTKDMEANIELRSGQDIMDAYEGRLGFGSCMAGEDNCHKVDLYVKNPNKVQLLVYDVDVARALLWTTDEGEKVLDRIYPNDGYHVKILRAWADKKGYLNRKNEECYFCGIEYGVDEQGERKRRALHVTLQHGGIFPYADTFIYVDKYEDDTIVLTDVLNTYRSHVYTLCSTEGGIPGLVDDEKGEEDEDDRIECEDCGFVGYDDEIYYTPNGAHLCISCYENTYISCYECGEDTVRDEAVVKDNRLYCDHCFDELFVRCYKCEDVVKNEYSIELNDELYCNYCYEEIKQQQQKEEEEKETESCG